MPFSSENKSHTGRSSVRSKDTISSFSDTKVALSESIDESCSFTSDESSSSLSTDHEVNQVADISTSSRNCWSQPQASTFTVRGKNYMEDKRKVPSAPCLFSTRGCELFLSDNADETATVARNPAVLGGNLRKVPTLLVNLRFPWGVLVLTFKIEDKFLPFLRCRYGLQPDLPPLDHMNPAEQRLARFFLDSDDHRNNSLKMIPKVVEGPWIVRPMVAGTPVIIGNKVPINYNYEAADPSHGLAEYLEVQLDVGPALKPRARKIVSICRRYMETLSLDIGFVIEGSNVDELPEQMLAVATIHKFNPQYAPVLNANTATRT